MVTPENFKKLSILEQKENIIKILQENPDILSRNFSVINGYPCSVWYIQKLYGSWLEAKKIAGLCKEGYNANQEFLKLNIEQQKQEIIKIIQEKPDITQRSFLVKNGYPCSFKYINNLFNCSWSKTKELAGIINVGSSLEARLLAKRNIDENGCWNWTGSAKESGYGEITDNNKRWATHRLSYTLYKEKIPDNFQVDHICGNPKCFNPEHLQCLSPQQHSDIESVRGKLRGTIGPKFQTPDHKNIEERIKWLIDSADRVGNNCFKPKIKPDKIGRVRFQWQGLKYTLSRMICSNIYNKDYKDKSWKACHTCRGNYWCCNPEHLYPGTDSDNINDFKLYAKNTILTEQDVREIKSIQLETNPFKNLTQWDEHIASIYNVCSGTISDIRANRTWKGINV